MAQQVEQRETLAIQYTIELRTMLRDMPVRDEIREFLFKTWAEVLALSAVRDGAQHADTVMFKANRGRPGVGGQRQTQSQRSRAGDPATAGAAATFAPGPDLDRRDGRGPRTPPSRS